MNLRRMMAIMVKELRQLARDRLTGGMIVGIPVLQLLLFGFAINLDVRGLPAAVADQSQTSASRAVVQDLLSSGVIEVVETAHTPEELMANEAIRKEWLEV